MASDEPLHVTVVLALPERQSVVPLEVPHGTTVAEALRRSGLLTGPPGEDFRVGVFGKRRKLSERLSDGDRVEIYRPLSDDPKNIRRRRAARRT